MTAIVPRPLTREQTIAGMHKAFKVFWLVSKAPDIQAELRAAKEKR